MLEAEHIRSLQHDVEARTAQRNHVPVSQVTRTETRTTDEDLPAVLTGEQRMSKWLEQRGAYRYAGETGRLSFGRIVRALATGNRDGMSDLEQRALAEAPDPQEATRCAKWSRRGSSIACAMRWLSRAPARRPSRHTQRRTLRSRSVRFSRPSGPEH